MFEGFKGLNWGLAETLILTATLFWAVETVLVKKFLSNVDAIVLAWGRMFFGTLAIFVFLAVTNNLAGLTAVNQTQCLWLVLVSALLTGYVVTWYLAIKRLPATVVTCVLVLASPITTLLNSIFITHKILAAEKIFGLGLIVLSVIAIWYRLKTKNILVLREQN
jgi:drug/metabolite transporter (DMT)-like permease